MLAISVQFVSAKPIRIGLSSFNVSHFSDSPGLYFEKRASGYVASASWNVVSFIRLVDMHDAFDSLEANSKSLRSACFEKNTLRGECKNIVIQIEDRLARIDAKNELIFNEHHMVKRKAVTI